MNLQRVVHFHIFKNAGTSVDAALETYFHEKWRPFEGELADSNVDAHEIQRFFEMNEDVLAVSSHTARPRAVNGDFTSVCFLRNPILRTRSVYNFLRKDSTQSFHDIASQTDFSGFIDLLTSNDLKNTVGAIIVNAQIRFLSNVNFRVPSIVGVQDLHDCMRLIKSWGGVGIVEDFESSRAWYEASIRRHYPDFTLNSYWDNRTRQTCSLDESAELEEIRSDLGITRYKKLLRENMFDLALYDWARNFNDTIREWPC